jgi:hypothetical protein
MKIGTRSILFGAHCWFIHPWFVAAAWSKLYGFPTDLRIWVAFFVHDLGYWGKPNIDGVEGESHPILGADIMSRFDHKFIDDCQYADRTSLGKMRAKGWRPATSAESIVLGDRTEWWSTRRWLYVYEYQRTDWHDFVLCHSRYYADKIGKPTSKLYAADKLAMILEPAWLYLPRVILSGEYREFKERATSKYGVAPELVSTPLRWYRITVAMMKRRAAGEI